MSEYKFLEIFRLYWQCEVGQIQLTFYTSRSAFFDMQFFIAPVSIKARYSVTGFRYLSEVFSYPVAHTIAAQLITFLFS